MNERVIPFFFRESGTLAANVTYYLEFPVPVTYLTGKAAASNDSSATVAMSGAAGGLSIAAKAIGDSGDPANLTPTAAEKASTCGNNANSLITVTLDFDGAAGTAAENVFGVLLFAYGEA